MGRSACNKSGTQGCFCETLQQNVKHLERFKCLQLTVLQCIYTDMSIILTGQIEIQLEVFIQSQRILLFQQSTSVEHIPLQGVVTVWGGRKGFSEAEICLCTIRVLCKTGEGCGEFEYVVSSALTL